MGTSKKCYHSLRFKITVSLLLAVALVLAATSYLRYLSFRQLLTESLQLPAGNAEEIVESQLAYYVRSRVILSASTVVVLLLISDLLMRGMVVGRLKQFLGVVRQIRPGNLEARVTTGGHDEIAELGEAFNRMTTDLQRQAEKLSTLNTLAVTVGQSLELEEVLRTALDEVLEVTRLGAGWITLRGEADEAHGYARLRPQAEQSRIVASRGLPEEAVLAHARCTWNRGTCAEVFGSGRPQVFRHDQIHGASPCPAAEYLKREGLLFRACVPLGRTPSAKSKDAVLGVMSLAGAPSGDIWMFTEDSLDMLTAIGRQIGIAIENASLYEELRQKEVLRRQLLERMITLQEEERRRMARELHDQTGQRLTSMIMTLGLLEEVTPTPEGRAYVRDVRDTAAQVLKEVRDLALYLRPSVLDDLGLLAALRHCLMGYQNRYRLLVDFQVLGLDDGCARRLPPEVETALFRITQEALMNVVQHAQARSVTVLLELSAARSEIGYADEYIRGASGAGHGAEVMLIVEDDGQGFDVEGVMNTRPHEGNLGLYGMRERALLLGGTLTIESTPGRGTAVFVRIPVAQ